MILEWILGVSGGKIEGEEVENCLRRELFEEIGVIAKRYSFSDSYDFKYPTKIYNLHLSRSSL